MREEEVETPALLIDLDAFEHNLARMQRLLEPSGIRLRPHAKTHKSPVIARLQQRHGAIGVCVQKVSEAEAMVWGGIDDILVSNEIVGNRKLARLAALSRIATISVCVDDPSQVAALEYAAEAAGTRLRVLVEIDAGSARCGVAPGEEGATLAAQIAASPGLIFGGLQAYHGSAQHLRTLQERETQIDGAVMAVTKTLDALSRRKLACPVVTGGGTGTFELEAASGVYTEVQAGSYVFMDEDYGRNLGKEGAPVSTFCNALFVLSTVMSRARPGMAVLDAGIKALAMDSGMPRVWKQPGLRYVRASDEHGEMEIAPESQSPLLGQKLRLVPGHCDPTVANFDWYVGVRRGRVECLWPVAGRGALY
ncbi:MAG: alanine racemase [Acidobacteria bacterium]|nr:alanine racemase [Acidobacteriota bacterium]